jgi:hypothetical protein
MASADSKRLKSIGRGPEKAGVGGSIPSLATILESIICSVILETAMLVWRNAASQAQFPPAQDTDRLRIYPPRLWTALRAMPSLEAMRPRNVHLPVTRREEQNCLR